MSAENSSPVTPLMRLSPATENKASSAANHLFCRRLPTHCIEMKVHHCEFHGSLAQKPCIFMQISCFEAWKCQW